MNDAALYFLSDDNTARLAAAWPAVNEVFDVFTEEDIDSILDDDDSEEEAAGEWASIAGVEPWIALPLIRILLANKVCLVGGELAPLATSYLQRKALSVLPSLSTKARKAKPDATP